MLRSGPPEDEKLRAYADTISGALKRNRLKHDVICYRGVDKDIYAEKIVGEIFTEEQFISTSVTKKGAMDKEYTITIFAKKGARAGYIENLSHYKSQRELLLDMNTQFRVISKHRNNIVLEVLG